MLQATVCNGWAFDLRALSQDCLSSAEVDISRSEVVDALVIALMFIIGHEDFDLSFQFTGQIVVVKQDTIFERLMPPFNLALGLRMIRGAASYNVDFSFHTPKDKQQGLRPHIHHPWVVALVRADLAPNFYPL